MRMWADSWRIGAATPKAGTLEEGGRPGTSQDMFANGLQASSVSFSCIDDLLMLGFSLLSLVLTFISVLLENRKLLPDSTTPLHALACYSTSRRLFRQDSGDLSKISVTSRRPLPQENPSISTSSDSQINRSVEEQQYTALSHLIQSSKSFNTTPDQSLFQEKCTNPFFGQIDENRIDSTAYNDSGCSEANLRGYTSATSPRDV